MEKRKAPSKNFFSRWWVAPTLVFLSSRLLNLFYIFVALPSQYVDSTKVWRQSDQFRPVDFATIMSNWDSGIYYLIAEAGYPQVLPRDPTSGLVTMNEWAFYPLWPAILRALHEITGLPYPLIGPILASLFALGGILLLVKLLNDHTQKRWPGLCLAVGLSFFPASVVFQIGYAEGLFVFLMGAFFLLLRGKKYYWAGLVIVLLSLTRPVVLPLALALAILMVVRWRRKGSEVLPLGLLSLLAGLSFAFWPMVAGFYTGVPNAYLETQEGWRFAGTDAIGLLMLKPWVYPGLTAFYLLVAGIVGLALFGLRSKRQRWPEELKAWGLAYFLYLALTVQGAIYAGEDGRVALDGSPVLHPSLWRYLMLVLVPLLPIGLLAKEEDSRTRKVLILLAVSLLGTVGSYFFVRYHLIDNKANGLYFP